MSLMLAHNQKSSEMEQLNTKISKKDENILKLTTQISNYLSINKELRFASVVCDSLRKNWDENKYKELEDTYRSLSTDYDKIDNPSKENNIQLAKQHVYK